VKIIAPTNIPATMPAGAATFYARNISALLTHFVKDGLMNYDFSDEITAATVITYRGEVVHAPTAKLLGQEPAAAPAPAPAPAVVEAPAPVAEAEADAEAAEEVTAQAETSESTDTTSGGAA
jgi:NAD(P) transhydrogenase subunit alpha